MDLIERYVYAVGRRLPAKQRTDIELELKSLIQDSLDARTGGAQPSEADIVAVLKELGHPSKIAANYTQAGNYLIGPRLFEVYRLVAPIAVAAVALGLCVAFAVEAIASGGRADILKFIGTLISGCISAVGSVTILFAVGERLLPDAAKPAGVTDDWNPKDLPPVVPPRQQVKLSEPIVALVFTVLGMLVFNLFPQVLSLHFQNSSGVWQSLPLFDPAAMVVYLPLWNISWVLALVYNATLLAIGRRTTLLNIMDVIQSLVSIGILVFMQRGPMLISTSLREIHGLGAVTLLIEPGYRLSLTIITVIVVIDTIRKVFVTVRSALDIGA